MDLRRLHTGEWVLGTSGAVLLGTLFVPWYTPELTAWEALAVLDIVLALIAASVAAVLLVTAVQSVPAVPVALDSLVTLVGVAATVLVVARALDLPDGATGREWGLWLGLAGAVGIVVGGFVSIRDERLPRSDRRTDHTGLPAPPPAPIETLPAPPKEGAT